MFNTGYFKQTDKNAAILMKSILLFIFLKKCKNMEYHEKKIIKICILSMRYAYA